MIGDDRRVRGAHASESGASPPGRHIRLAVAVVVLNVECSACMRGGHSAGVPRRQRGAAIATELDAAERARIEKMLASRDSENRPKT